MAVSVGAFLLAWVLWGEDVADRAPSALRVAAAPQSCREPRASATPADMRSSPAERPRVLGRGRRASSCSTSSRSGWRRRTFAPSTCRTDHRRRRAASRCAFNPGAAFSMSLGDASRWRVRRASPLVALVLPVAPLPARRGPTTALRARARTRVGRRGRQPHRPPALAAAWWTSSTSASATCGSGRSTSPIRR